MFAMVDSITITSISTYVEDDDGAEARISCTHQELTIFVSGDLVNEDYTNTFVLNKENGRWLICEIIDQSQLSQV